MTDREEWTVEGVQVVYSDQWLTLKHEHVRLADGHEIPAYNIIEQNDFCLMVAITADLHIPLVRQYKHGARATVLEFPAGLVESGERPEVSARRELLEETGYAGDDPVRTGRLLTNPTRNRNWAHFYVVLNARQVAEPEPEVTEDIGVDLVRLADVSRAIRDGQIGAMGSVCAYALARQAFPDLPWE